MKSSIKIIDRTCLIIVTIMTISLGYWSLNHRLNERETIDSGKVLYSGKSAKLSNVQKDLEYLVSIKGKKIEVLNALNKRIPDAPEVGPFLKIIDTYTKERNLGLVSVNPQLPAEEGAYNKIPVQIVLRGGFKKIYGLIHDLENMERLIVIDRLKVARSIEGKDCRVELIANIYSISADLSSQDV